MRDDVEVVRVRIRRVGRGQRAKVARAHVIIFDESDYGNKQYVADEFYDTFEVYLPDPVYEYYQIIRKEYSKYARKKLARILQVMEQAGEDISVRILKKRLGLEDEYT